MKKLFIRFLSVLLALQGYVAVQLLTVAPAHASETPAVVINEVMWMGSSLSIADEWIELRNLTSDPIDLAGWKLTNTTSSSGTLTISSGTIAGDGLFLIANYDKTEVNSVLNVTADLVASSLSISNTCSQIDLAMPDDTIVDSMGCDGGYFYPASSSTKHALERNVEYGDGLLPGSWHERTEGSANLDNLVVDLATPSFVNDVTAANTAAAAVNDGVAADIDWTDDVTLADANWSGFADDQSGIANYYVGLGTAVGLDDVVSFADVGLVTAHSFVLGSPLSEGTTYYATVQATNGVGLVSQLSSDGFTVDTLAPAPATNLSLSDVPGDNGGSVTLNWDASSSIDQISYRVDYNEVGSLLVLSKAGITDTNTVINGLANDPVDYEFTVTAVDFSSLESVGNPTVTGSAMDNLAPVLTAAKVRVGQNQPGTSDSLKGLASTTNEAATVMVFDRHPSSPVKTTIASVSTNGNLGFDKVLLGDNLYGSVWVQLIDEAGNASEPMEFTNDIVGPKAPVISKAESVCYSSRCQVEINWQSVSDAKSYVVRYSSGVQVKNSLPVSGTSLILDLSADESFQSFTVVAYDAYGNPSNVGQAFKAAMVPGVVTEACLINGKLVITTYALEGTKETTSSPRTGPPAKLVPTVNAADDTDKTDNTKVAGDQDWLRIAIVVILLLVVAGGFYSLSRSIGRNEVVAGKPVTVKTAKKAVKPKAATKSNRKKRRGKRKSR